ncbi:TIM barrel protein [soil metagenome]
MTNSVRLATAPINWGVESPDFPGNPDPDELLAAVAASGYQGCELGPFAYFGRSLEQVKERFASHSLAVVAIWLDIPLAAELDEQYRAVIDTAAKRLRDLGAEVLIISDLLTEARMAIVSRVEQFPDLRWADNQWLQVRATLLEIERISADHGLRLAVHPHVGGHIESGEEIERLLGEIEGTGIRLCLDTGHIRLGGSDPMAIFEIAADHVVHLHAKDIDEAIFAQLRSGALHYGEAVGKGLYCNLGSGIVDWQRYANIVLATGYSGWVVAEQDRLLVPGLMAPFDSNERNFTFLRDLLLT